MDQHVIPLCQSAELDFILKVELPSVSASFKMDSLLSYRKKIEKNIKKVSNLILCLVPAVFPVLLSTPVIETRSLFIWLPMSWMEALQLKGQ